MGGGGDTHSRPNNRFILPWLKSKSKKLREISPTGTSSVSHCLDRLKGVYICHVEGKNQKGWKCQRMHNKTAALVSIPKEAAEEIIFVSYKVH